MAGKRVRLKRIMDCRSGRAVIIPMDHGVTMGPVTGLCEMRRTIGEVAKGGANAIVLHKGLVDVISGDDGNGMGLIVHLSASTRLAPDPDSKGLVCTVEEAIRWGADGVSVHVNLGSTEEKSMLKDLGMVARASMEWGIPLLAMMYTRGPKIENQYDMKLIKHAARVGAELGADIVKVPYTGSPETFREVVEGCFVPVVIAGGERMDTDRDVLEMVKGAILAGGAGVSIGRNVFQHKNPMKMVRAIRKIVFQNSSIEEALEELKEGGR